MATQMKPPMPPPRLIPITRAEARKKLGLPEEPECVRFPEEKKMKKIKELYYEADTRKHQQIVAELLISFAKKLLDRAIKHDASKLEEPERSHYVEPVYALNTEEVPYGSDRYKELTAQMGKGWDHHKFANDHHIEFFIPYSVQTLNDPLRALDLFALVEMLADWIAASRRRNNNPAKALDFMKEKFHVDEQVEMLIRNTLAMMERQFPTASTQPQPQTPEGQDSDGEE